MELFASVQKYYSYAEFLQLMEKLVAEGKTTGTNNPSEFVFYTKLNLQRYQKWDKIFTLSDTTIAKATTVRPQIWWLINEGWCGDAAQSLPVMAKIAEASGGNIDLRIIMRDENLSIMDKYLTNGGRSIPKLISTDKDGNELFNWGPRPAFAQKMMMDWKADHKGISFEEIERELHLWYAKDKGASTEQELSALL